MRRPPPAFRALVSSSLCLLGALGCEIGDLDVPIGSDRPSEFYVSPLGDDSAAGTRAEPWLTLRRGTRALRPGNTLLLLPGDYHTATTGLLDVDCTARHHQGEPDAPITVRAVQERRAALQGDGAQPPLSLRGCHHWVIEGLTLSSEHDAEVPAGTDVGSVAMLHGGRDLTLRRLLLFRPNNQRHTHVLRVLEASRVLIEECEAYDFFHNAFEAVRSAEVTFRRNYLHSRNAVSSGNVVALDEPTRGEVAIQVEESSSPVLENNLAEVVGIGFSVVGRAVGASYTNPSPYPVSGARLFGNLVHDALGPAFRVETRCNDAVPCTEAERIARDTLIVHGVAQRATTGVLVDAGPGTRVDNVTLVNVANGVQLQRSTENQGVDYSASASRALVRGYTGVAFSASDASDWSFEHCAAESPGAGALAFAPDDGHVMLPVSVTSDDSCVAYLHRDSPFRGAAGVEGDVGANVTHRYVDGVLTDEPLWDAESGAFPCGAVVPGVNDDVSQSCTGAHRRLLVGTAECPLPP